MGTDNTASPAILKKTPTGITGLDEITGGGLPSGRPTLLTGAAGSGKTMISMEFLVQGALNYDEPGVFIAFEETTQDLETNFASRGYDLSDLERTGRLSIDYVYVEPSEIAETGEYDLQPLFIRIGYAIDSIGAKRVVLDTIEVLFSGLQNSAILRAELRRLFRFLKQKGVTAIVTGERGGEGAITRYGLEEYVADCVIVLDHRMQDHLATRRMRVLKYRGSSHGTNEFPFLITDSGISVLPVTSVELSHTAPLERVSSGIEGLDAMMSGLGYFRGSSVLVSGDAGTGKTSIGASFVSAACQRGEKAAYFSFEESPDQLARNMASVGIDLRPLMDSGMLEVHSTRQTQYGLEAHLALMTHLVKKLDPRVVVIDPITNLTEFGDPLEAKATASRLIDFLKSRGVTSIFTSMSRSDSNMGLVHSTITSLIDTWILLRNTEMDGERNRLLYVLKSRGMAHSNQIREFRLTDEGILLLDPVFVNNQPLLGRRREHEVREAEK